MRHTIEHFYFRRHLLARDNFRFKILREVQYRLLTLQKVIISDLHLFLRTFAFSDIQLESYYTRDGAISVFDSHLV